MSVEAKLFDLKAEVLACALRRRQPQGRIDKNAILDQLRSGTSMEDTYLRLGVLAPHEDEPTNRTNEDLLTRFWHNIKKLIGL